MELETRYCAAGCGRKFKTLPASHNYFCCAAHAHACLISEDSDRRAKAKRFFADKALKENAKPKRMPKTHTEVLAARGRVGTAYRFGEESSEGRFLSNSESRISAQRRYAAADEGLGPLSGASRSEDSDTDFCLALADSADLEEPL